MSATDNNNDKIVKVAINGFGRIGRMVLRVCVDNPNIEVVAVNDPFIAPDYMVYQFKYDSTQGMYRGAVSVDETTDSVKFVINGEETKKQVARLRIGDRPPIRVFQEKDHSIIPWDECKADYVVEATGIFIDQRAYDHVKKPKDKSYEGVRRVIVSAPSKWISEKDAKYKAEWADKKKIPMFVMGVNHRKLKSAEEQRVISNASCTTNCLAPIVKVIDDTFGLVEGLMTTVHAVTATQKPVDAPSGKDWRSGRGAFQNIIPASTGAAVAVGKVLPQVNGKLTGMAFRVPVPDGSVVDLTFRTEKAASKQDLDDAFLAASRGKYIGERKQDDDFDPDAYVDFPTYGVIGYYDKETPIVSTDIIGDPRATIYDQGAGISLAADKGTFHKVVSWYDNEWGYSNKLVELLMYAASIDGVANPKPLVQPQ